MNGKLSINLTRLTDSIAEMGRIGRRPGLRGVTRLALSEEDGEARDLLVHWMKDEGLRVSVDSIGNVFGVREGSDPGLRPVIMGSHLDTVIDAGVYDGAYGVLSALEVVRRLRDEGVETRHPIGVGCFTNEEGVRFQPDMMGSLVKTGGYPLDKVYTHKDDEGVTVREALEGIGYLGSAGVDPSAYGLVVIGTPVNGFSTSLPIQGYLTQNKGKLPAVAFYATYSLHPMGTLGGMEKLAGKKPVATEKFKSSDIKLGKIDAKVDGFVAALKK